MDLIYYGRLSDWHVGAVLSFGLLQCLLASLGTQSSMTIVSISRAWEWHRALRCEDNLTFIRTSPRSKSIRSILTLLCAIVNELAHM